MGHRLKRLVIDPAKASEAKSEATACHGQIRVNARGSCKERKLQKGKAFFIMEEKCTARLYWSS